MQQKRKREKPQLRLQRVETPQPFKAGRKLPALLQSDLLPSRRPVAICTSLAKLGFQKKIFFQLLVFSIREYKVSHQFTSWRKFVSLSGKYVNTYCNWRVLILTVYSFNSVLMQKNQSKFGFFPGFTHSNIRCHSRLAKAVSSYMNALVLIWVLLLFFNFTGHQL